MSLSNTELELWSRNYWMNPQICIPVRSDIIFNKQIKNINFGRPKTIEALHKVFSEGEGYVVVVYQKDQKIENPTPKDLSEFGTLCIIDKSKSEINRIENNVCLKAIARVRILKYLKKQPNDLLSTHVVVENVDPTNEKKEKILLTRVLENLKNQSKYIQQSSIGSLFEQDIRNLEINNPAAVILFLIKWLKVRYETALIIFETKTIVERLELILDELNNFSELNKLEKSIETRFRKQLSQRQKEYFLREKIKVFQEELGKLTGEASVAEELRARLKKGHYPDHITKRLEREIDRFEASPMSSADANITRQYIETLLNLPWYKETDDVMDLEIAKKELNKNHYGLDKVKERIIEQLAVVFHTKKNSLETKQTSIICLVGPPGVGKTSLGQSIAKAMGRKFTRVALGGIRDEAEIRGHRKTYVGAMPGRIMKAMIKIGVKNPLFLLDEVDKMASDYRGDPSAAMLEVLDPEQNKAFNDNYIEEDFDLSKVIFICTANNYDAIPDPLLDRMEIIHLSSYTEQEKLHIAKDHLIKKVLFTVGLTKKQINFADSGIMEIIRRYTREAGVRELQRLLEKISRVHLVNISSKKRLMNKKINITRNSVIDYLKKPLYDFQKKDAKKIPGLVNGLAYTIYGGDVLPIEVTFFKGTGKLTLTGRLGEVFQESANIAVNYIKSHAKRFGIDIDFFSKNDIHLHCPEGAIPKDGPSAGITITTAVLSIIKKEAVDNNLGMTGEITLHGQVLKIGGLKEKVISAHRSGLKRVIFPKSNVIDLNEIPEEVKKEIKMIPVQSYLEVFTKVFK